MRRSLSWSWKPDSNTVLRIRDGNRKMRRPEVPPNRIKEIEMAEANSSNAPKKVAKKVSIKSTDGLVPLKKICADLKIDPRMARRKLRSAKITGHDARDRWNFKKGSNAYDKAREVLAA
jgi:hypothetical protein